MTADDLNIPAPLAPLAPLAPPRRVAPWLATLFSSAPLLLLLLLPMAARYIEGPEAVRSIRKDVNVDATRVLTLLLIGVNITLAVSLHLINGISGQFSLGHAGFMAVGAYTSAYATVNYSNKFTASPGILLYFISLFTALAIAAAGIGIIYLFIQSTRRISRSLPGFLVLILFAWVTMDLILSSRAIAPEFDFTIKGWHFHLAYSPVWPYLISLVTGIFNDIQSYGGKPIIFLLALLGGGLAAAVAGLVVGLPTLRLRGDYLAIATLGFALILQNLIELSPALGAATGLTGIPKYNARVNINGLQTRTEFMFPWIYGTAIVCIFVVWRLTRSPIGRAILAVREDEVAAASVGINATQYKIKSFVIGAFFAGVAGGLYAHFYSGSLTPKEFEWTKSVELVVIVTLGGLGNLWGTIIAAILLTFLPDFLNQPQFWIEWMGRPFRPAAPPGSESTSPSAPPAALKWMADNRQVVYSLLLIGAMLLKSRNYSRFLPWRRKRA